MLSPKVREFYRANPEKLLEAFEELLIEVGHPPAPWVPFGTWSSVPQGEDVELTFWGEGEDGLPLWERATNGGRWDN